MCCGWNAPQMVKVVKAVRTIFFKGWRKMQELMLTTTTSVYDSGLLAQLVRKFEGNWNYQVNVISVGSGLALDLARQGRSDVLIVHDPQSEQQFMAEGFGINRQLVMHNDFVLAGPLDDPAKISDCLTVTEAFQKLAATKTLFISRDDASGTDKREKLLWNMAQVDKNTVNSQATKSGMAKALTIASAKNGYVLTDRATYLAKKPELNLRLVLEGDDLLLNVYHVIQVNPQKFPHVNVQGAQAFTDFLLGEGQRIIDGFLENRPDSVLFVPAGGRNLDEVRQTQNQQAYIY